MQNCYAVENLFHCGSLGNETHRFSKPTFARTNHGVKFKIVGFATLATSTTLFNIWPRGNSTALSGGRQAWRFPDHFYKLSNHVVQNELVTEACEEEWTSVGSKCLNCHWPILSRSLIWYQVGIAVGHDDVKKTETHPMAKSERRLLFYDLWQKYSLQTCTTFSQDEDKTRANICWKLMWVWRN